MRRIGLPVLASALLLVVPINGCAGTTTPGSAVPASSAGSTTPVPTRAPLSSPQQRASTAASAPRSATTAVTVTTSAASSVVLTPGTTVTVEGSQWGDVLFDDSGQAIYLFDTETSTEAACYDDCAAAWPPVLTDGAPVAGGSVHGDALGTTSRRDGGVQVTYGGHPLYVYAGEGKHVVTCHDVVEYGGRWLAVAPSGDAAEH